jgi:hypothetical protein
VVYAVLAFEALKRLFFILFPALTSFSVYAAVGILAIYFFQCTFFVAWMAIDQVLFQKFTL